MLVDILRFGTDCWITEKGELGIWIAEEKTWTQPKIRDWFAEGSEKSHWMVSGSFRRNEDKRKEKEKENRAKAVVS